MKALVLGAGYATRLYPLTRDRPKPLLPIGGRPILDRIVDRLQAVPELDRILVVSNHRFVGHYYRWMDQRGAPKVPVEIYDDMTTSNEDRLGAIGDIQFVVEHARIQEDLLVVAGDNLFEFPVKDFARFGRERGTSVGLYDLPDKTKLSLYGVVEIDGTGRVVDFEEKPPRPRSSLVSMGMYYLPAKELGRVAQYLKEGRGKDAPGYYLQWLIERASVFGYVIPGKWYDIGDIDSYNRAHEEYSG